MFSRLLIRNVFHSILQHSLIGHFITKRHQVVVEVLEATGLRSSDLNGLANPYAKGMRQILNAKVVHDNFLTCVMIKVGLIYATKKRRVGSFSNKLARTTYYVPKTLSPQWSDQSFVFDVPESVYNHEELRRFSILCVLKSSEIGKNKFLGQGKLLPSIALLTCSCSKAINLVLPLRHT